MNIDDRLQALAQTVELLAELHRDHEKANAVNEKANAEKFAALMDTMNRLGRIIEMHEHRLDSHDDRLDHLEGEDQ